jgi:hypothetical protein
MIDGSGIHVYRSNVELEAGRRPAPNDGPAVVVQP